MDLIQKLLKSKEVCNDFSGFWNRTKLSWNVFNWKKMAVLQSQNFSWEIAGFDIFRVLKIIWKEKFGIVEMYKKSSAFPLLFIFYLEVLSTIKIMLITLDFKVSFSLLSNLKYQSVWTNCSFVFFQKFYEISSFHSHPQWDFFFNYEENLNGWRNWFVKNSPLVQAFSRRMAVEQIHTSW